MWYMYSTLRSKIITTLLHRHGGGILLQPGGHCVDTVHTHGSRPTLGMDANILLDSWSHKFVDRAPQVRVMTNSMNTFIFTRGDTIEKMLAYLRYLIPAKPRPRMRAKSRATFCAGRCLLQCVDRA
jgi:hypothetical protein